MCTVQSWHEQDLPEQFWAQTKINAADVTAAGLPRVYPAQQAQHY